MSYNILHKEEIPSVINLVDYATEKSLEHPEKTKEIKELVEIIMECKFEDLEEECKLAYSEIDDIIKSTNIP